MVKHLLKTWIIFLAAFGLSFQDTAVGAFVWSVGIYPGEASLLKLSQKLDLTPGPYLPLLPTVSTPGSGLNLFRQAVSLIKEYYVDSISERNLFKSVTDTLLFILPPHCSEEVAFREECSGAEEDCLIQALQHIAEPCHLDPDRLFLKALNIMLRSLDHNSTLLDPAMMNELKITTAGKFGGVGMVVTARNNDYVVVSSFDSSPAQKAGVGAGDTILEIDDTPLHGLPMWEVLSMVRGPAGSMMSAVVKSNKTGEVRKVRLKRRIIRIAPVRSSIIDRSIAYLRIVNFQEDTAREVEKAMSRMFRSEPRRLRGLILDLRDNPGGLFEEAIKVAGLFRPSSIITSLKGRNPQVNRDFFSPEKYYLPEVPTVVLINKGSASASEIFAGALQGLSSVLVLGERSFGKASVQVVFPLSDGMALRLTTAHYYTADGRDIEGKGIEPDVGINSPESSTTQKIGFTKPSELSDDPEIRIALEYLLRGRLPSKSPFSSWY